MKPILHVKGPGDAGPGERQEMLATAARLLEQLEVEAQNVVRVDVPARGGEDGGDTGRLRVEVEVIIPTLQSGSLFGGRQGLEVVDAQFLRASEAEVLAELLGQLDPQATAVVVVSTGRLPAPLAEVVRSRGEVVEVKKLRERDAASWLGEELHRRKLRLDSDVSGALLQRFGSDVAALSQALDQLAVTEGPVTKDVILERFRNRPDEPMWHYADAVAEGDTGEALRRLSDFLTHGHPLQLIAFLESDLRWRSLAAAAPDAATFAEWVGGRPDDFRVRKAWRRRGATSDSELRAALSALSRADRLLKTAPEASHRLTMERLTVALCRRYGGRARRVG